MTLPDLEIVNGYEIVRVERVVGVFWAVRGTGRSFLTLGDARRFAESGIIPSYHPAVAKGPADPDAAPEKS